MAEHETNTAPADLARALAHFEDMVRRHACGDRGGAAVTEARAAVLALAAPAASSEGSGPAAQGAPTQSLTDQQIEKLAVKHEVFGFGWVDEKGYTTHGFDPDGLGAFARELMALAAPVGQAEDAARWRKLTSYQTLSGDVAHWNGPRRKADADAWIDAIPARKAVQSQPGDAK